MSMEKDTVKTLLHTYNPTPVESSFKERMLTFLDMYDNCFERSLAVGHFTASAWLLNKEGNQALLMHHAKLNKWLQLGGHADGNSDLLAVAIREAQEESGIMAIIPVSTQFFDIDIHLIPEHKHELEHYHYDIRFLLQVASDEPITANDESHELRWISKDPNRLPPLDASTLRLFTKWVALPSASVAKAENSTHPDFL